MAARDQNEVEALREQLDPGEAVADLRLLDEKRGRRVAESRGLEVTGLLGVLDEAKTRGLIARCQPGLDEMIRVTGFWIGDDPRARCLRSLNELD